MDRKIYFSKVIIMEECFNKLGLTDVIHLKSAGQKDVYSGKSNKYGDIVIKIIRPGQNAERIEREIEIIERLNNINTSLIHEHGDINCSKGSFKYIIESFIKGDCLKDYLLNKKVLSYEQVIDYLNQMLEILEILEKNNIVHRDIKPDNIIITNEKEYFLIDFGISRVLDKDSITSTGADYGPATVLYAPIEQIENKKSLIDSRVDVYSTCIIAYEMITGKNPYYEEGCGLPKIMRNVEKGEFIELTSEEYEDIDAFINTCMNKFIGRRPSSAAEARKWFKEII